MEINDLKSVWKKANDQEKPGYWVSEEDVRGMIRKKSRATISDVLGQLKQKIRMSGVIGSATLILSLTSIFVPDASDNFVLNESLTNVQYGIMMMTMSLCILTISIHTTIRYKQVKNLEQSADSLKLSLYRTRQIFQKLIKAGIISDTIITPLVMVFIAGFKVYANQAFLFDIRLFYLFLAAIILALFFNRLAAYLMKRKFGRFIRALDSRLQELEALESEEGQIG
ncbi:MAG: hypothetical protein HEP71_30355 [Roseivirga sp.]|nr:hypothetical protein [Roseivirga sp.]